MTNLFFFPHKITEEIFKKNNLFLDLYGFYKYKNDKKEYIKIEFFNFEKNSFLKRNPPDNIISKINEWGPVWSRFVDAGYNYEHKKREILLKFYEIANFFINKKIKKVIMSTYISHNINSLLIDLICERLKIRQFFFFNSMELLYNKENRLLFIEQRGFKNRNFLKKKLSNFKFDSFIKQKQNFLINQINNKEFIYNSFWGHNLLHKNFIFSIFFFSIYYFYSNLKEKIINKKKFFNIMEFKTISHIHVMIQQKKAIDFYKKNINLIKLNNNEKHLVISAHYQPEATSYPMGQEWNNHIDIVIELRRKGYNKKIFYKEHPLSFNFFDNSTKHYRIGVSRSMSYYLNLLKLNCQFLDSNLNSFSKDFLDSFLPITISGTIALERSIYGYKTIYFGHPWWKDMPGTISIKNIKQLSNIKNLFGSDKKIAENSLKFLSNLLNKKSFNNFVGMHNLHNNRGFFSQFKKSMLEVVK
jgi:hypothetical protein